MSYSLTPELDQMVRERISTGGYRSEEEVLRAALTALDAEESTIAAIGEGIADIDAGRHRPWEEADEEFRAAQNIPQDV